MKHNIIIFTLSVFFSSLSYSADIKFFHLNDVRLLDSPFKTAQDKDLEYLLALAPDKLLSPYLREAGLKPKTESYGNWEATGLDGHIGGHYLTALSLAYASTGQKEFLVRLNYMVDELKRAQDAVATGYIGGIPGGKAMWEHVAKGEIRADLFGMNEKWVPWYNVHKIYAGLRDAYLIGDNQKAKEMFIALCDWTVALTKNLTDEQVQTMLITEHGGMNEVFADAYKMTGNKNYLKLARQFSHNHILNPLLEKRDDLSGKHANTQIPKAVGFKRVAEVSNDNAWDEAAAYFWDVVVNERSVAIGGNSVREHFHDKHNFKPMIDDVEGPETCNTYNMLKLSKMLYGTRGDQKYVSFYERALYNHILSSQHPETGGLVYFTSMRPQQYRVYSQVDKAMWCCVGSGIESHVKYGEFIYAHEGNNLYVNLFIPSQLDWKEKGIKISQTNIIPDEEGTRLAVAGNGRFTLQVRYPAWVKNGKLLVKVNGKKVASKVKKGAYIAIDREWKSGDVVEIKLPMNTYVEQLPDGSDYFAVLHGPFVMAAKTNPFDGEKVSYFADDTRMGHIARGQMCALNEAPIFVSKNKDFAKKIKVKSLAPLVLVAPKLIQNNGSDTLELIPFFRVHESRYIVYWPYSTPQGLAERKAEEAQTEVARMALLAQTIDQVAPGEQQPESDHFFKAEKSEAGVHRGKHWRHAYSWFSYQLKDPKNEAKRLRITYYGLDGGRHYDILINDIVVATVHSNTDKGDAFYDVDYALSAEVLAAAENGVLVLKFDAHKDSMAGGIYGVRLMR